LDSPPASSPETARRERRWTRATWALLALHVAVIAATFGHYGITYDEEWRARYGEYVLRWYATLGEDRRALNFWTLHYEGGFWGAVQQIVAMNSPLGRYETGHLLNALAGALGALGAARVGRKLGGRKLGGAAAGFFSALLLISMPRWYGDLFANPADVPMATLTIWALAFLLDLLERMPRPGLALLAKLGATLGLALAVRMGALIAVLYVGWALALWWVGRRGSGAPARGDALAALRALAVAGVAAWIAMVAFWPKALVSPPHPLRGLRAALRFEQSIPVLFEGETISNQDLPWWYVLRWFSLVTPEHVLALALAAAALGLAAFLRAPRASARIDGGLQTFAVASAVVAPLTYASLGGAIDYDGIRHFLFVLPPLAVVCALAALRVARALPRPARWAGGAWLAASIAFVASDMARLHPYEYVYFNRWIAGGLAGAAGRFDLEYWGACQRESALWLAEHRAERIDGRRPRVASTGFSLSAAYFLPAERFDYVGSVDDGTDAAARWREEEGDPWPDYFLAQPRWDGYRRFPGASVHSIERFGVELARIVAVEPRAR
jgi:hypothetical protein